MSKLVKLSVLGATGAVVCLAAPIGGGSALAGPVGLASETSVALPATTDAVHYRRIYHGRSAYYCPPRYTHRSAYYAPRRTVIIERRTAYVAAPVATVAAPVVAAGYGYPYGYGYGYGDPGLVGAGAGLLGGILNVGLGGWGGPGWGPGWGGWGYGPGWRWRRRWW